MAGGRLRDMKHGKLPLSSLFKVLAPFFRLTCVFIARLFSRFLQHVRFRSQWKQGVVPREQRLNNGSSPCDALF